MVGHRIRLEGANLPDIGGAARSPRVVSILEQDFVTWLLDRMTTSAGRQELAARDAFLRGGGSEVARLWQPVHRAFNMVMVHGFCEVEGLPRLDPKKVLAAGVVVRRRVDGRPQGWVHADGQILGWRPLPPDATTEDAIWDPDPAIRKQAALGRNAKVLRQAALPAPASAGYEEAFAPLYPASPDLCKTLGRTLFFGYLPLSSDERSEADPAPAAPFGADLILERMPVFLWRDGRRGEMPSSERPNAPRANATVQPEEAADPSEALAVVINGVNYLAQETGLFTTESTPGEDDPTEDLKSLLQSFRVDVVGRRGKRSLYRVLKSCYELLLLRADDDETLRLPVEWPSFTAADESRFVKAIQKAMQARWAKLSPGETRFQDLAAEYELRAFLRIDRSDHGCPPETVWTPASQPFAIAPWYESGETPPTVVELPAPTPGFMDKLKPNVAFKVPEEIQKFMSGVSLGGLILGEKPGPNVGFGMICGFSIPILTICAFIVLQIFLSLLHILFWWLPLVRTCIPFPKGE